MPIMPWETELSLECGRSPNVSKAPHALTSAYRLDSTPQCPTCRSMPQSGSNCSHRFPWFLPFLRLIWLIFILFLLHSVAPFVSAPLLVLFQTSSPLLGPYESALASIVSLTQKVQLQESALESSSTYDIVNKIYQLYQHHANTFAQRRPAGWRNFA